MNLTLVVLFFLIYLVVVVAIGVIQSRREGEEGFMMADRQVHGAQLVATLSAGFFDGATLAIYTAYVYQYGFSAIWFFFGTIAGFLLLLKYATRIKARADTLGVYSMSEYFYRVFDQKNGLLFSAFLLIEYFGLLVVNLIIAGKIFSAIFSIPYPVGVIVGGIVILTYLLLAGFKAVVKTDFFQLIIMFLMTFMVAGILLGKSTLGLADLNILHIGGGDAIAFLIIGMLIIFSDPAVWQRIFAARDAQTLRRSLGGASLVLFILAIVVSVVGLVTKQFFPMIAPENALITGFTTLLPMGLKELGLVLLYAVSLSSSDTVTFVISSIITRDLKNYTQRFSTESMRKMARVFMLLCVAGVTLVAMLYQDILTLGFSISGMVIALVPVIIGSLYWKLNQNAVFSSLLLALLTVIGLFIFHNISPQTVVYSLPIALVSLIVFHFAARLARHQPKSI